MGQPAPPPLPHPSPQQQGRLGIGERIKQSFERKFIQGRKGEHDPELEAVEFGEGAAEGRRGVRR